MHNRAAMERSPVVRTIQIADRMDAAVEQLTQALRQSPGDGPEALEAISLASASLYWLDGQACEVSQDLLALAKRYYGPAFSPATPGSAQLREQMLSLLEQVRARARWRRQVETLR